MHPEEDNTQSAGSGDLRQRFARLTFLNIISNITVPLASMVDTALPLSGRLRRPSMPRQVLWASLP